MQSIVFDFERFYAKKIVIRIMTTIVWTPLSGALGSIWSGGSDESHHEPPPDPQTNLAISHSLKVIHPQTLFALKALALNWSKLTLRHGGVCLSFLKDASNSFLSVTNKWHLVKKFHGICRIKERSFKRSIKKSFSYRRGVNSSCKCLLPSDRNDVT